MANDIFKSIIDERVKGFINSFSDTSEKIFIDKSGKLIHSGEFGIYRERICKELIQTFIPSNLKISDGFIITSDNLVSTQCDLIVYDPNQTPLIEIEHNRFFPIESVKAVFEIKSNLDKSSLKNALVKLSNIKKLRKCTLDGKAGDTKNIFTVLLCKSFTFNSQDIEKFIDEEAYQGINYEHRHNMVLSIKDGLIAYNLVNCFETFNTLGFNYSIIDLEKSCFECPINLGVPLKSTFIGAREDNYHIMSFLNCISPIGNIETNTVELSRYLGFKILDQTK